MADIHSFREDLRTLTTKFEKDIKSMLELHRKKAALLCQQSEKKTEREIAVTDEKIDEIVYGL